MPEDLSRLRPGSFENAWSAAPPAHGIGRALGRIYRPSGALPEDLARLLAALDAIPFGTDADAGSCEAPQEVRG